MTLYSLSAVISELFCRPITWLEAFIRISVINFQSDNCIWLMKYSWLCFTGNFGLTLLYVRMKTSLLDLVHIPQKEKSFLCAGKKINYFKLECFQKAFFIKAVRFCLPVCLSIYRQVRRFPICTCSYLYLSLSVCLSLICTVGEMVSMNTELAVRERFSLTLFAQIRNT